LGNTNSQYKNIHTIPTCLSIVNILFPVPGSYSLEVTNFSTPKITPSLHLTATAVLRVLKKKIQQY